jgi:hypothetical protein
LGNRGEAFVASLEVFAVPVEDLRDLQAVFRGVVAVAATVGQKATHGVFELSVELAGDEGLLAQIRTADRGAYHGEVDARLSITAGGADEIMLDVVQVCRLAE